MQAVWTKVRLRARDGPIIVQTLAMGATMRRLVLLSPLCLLACTAGPSVEGDLLSAPTALYVAPDDLVEDVQEIADWRNRTGIPSQVVALSDALAEGNGSDDAAALKDYLRARWEGDGIEYVILAGDAGAMPHRDVWATVMVDAEAVYEEDWVTSDMYFADLDGEWDPDGEGEYGETEDSADLLPDIALGRLPVETAEEVQAYAYKLQAYERYPRADYQDKVLLSASYAGMGVYASAGIELIVVPQLPEHLRLTRLYEDWEDHEHAEELTMDGWVDALTEGHAITYHMGHGNELTMGPVVGAENVAEIPNGERPNVLITCECLGGRFTYDGQDSSGEEYVKGGTGGVVYMGSTHLGIGFPSFSLIMQELATDMFAEHAEPLRMGSCVRDVMRRYSDDEALHTEANVDRWQQLVTVVLGDPSVQLWSDIPELVYLNVEVSEDEVDVAVTDRAGEAVEGAQVTAYLPGEFLLSQTTGNGGHAFFEGDEDDFGEAVFTVTGRDLIPAEWSWDDQ